MITINSGKLTIPENERFIGFAGDNLHSTKQFLVENIADESCIYRLYLKFDDDTVNYFVLDSKVENGSTILTWHVLEEHIFKNGIVAAQIKSISDSGETYHTTWDYFLIASAAEFSGEFTDKENAEFLRYEKELNEIYKKINETDLNSFVTNSRTIAGLPLSSNITAEDLYVALNIYQPVLFEGPPTISHGPVGAFLIDTLHNDLYYCDKRTLSGHNWIKLTGASDSVSTDTKSLSQAQINNAGELVLTFSDGTTDNLGIVVGKNGSKGDAGADGKSAYEIALDNGFEGTEEEWLESLKGADGEDGVAPTVTLIPYDGGVNLYVQNGDSGGAQLVSIKDGADGQNGADGKDGYTPVKGVDYWTQADQESIIQQVITALGTPVFGRVDEENNIVLAGSLAEGEYTLKYEDDEGAVSEIGSLTIGADEPTYINYANPTSADWLSDQRLNSSHEVTTAVTGTQVTNFIPCKAGDVIRVKGLNVANYYANDEGTTARSILRFYSDTSGSPVLTSIPADDTSNYVYSNNVWTFTVGAGLSGDISVINYIRINGYLYDGYTKNDVVITVNQEIN